MSGSRNTSTRYAKALRRRSASRCYISYRTLPTLSLFLTTKLVYRPANIAAKPVAKKLFYNDYLNHLGTFGWREQHNIVFDHLVAPTAFYISKKEFGEWFEEVKAEDVAITWHNSNSWCGFGQL